MGFTVAKDKITQDPSRLVNDVDYAQWGQYDPLTFLEYLLASLSTSFDGYKNIPTEQMLKMANAQSGIKLNQLTISAAAGNQGKLPAQYIAAIDSFQKNSGQGLALPLLSTSGDEGAPKTMVVTKDSVSLHGEGETSYDHIAMAVLAAKANPDVLRHGININTQGVSAQEQAMWLAAAEATGIVVRNKANIQANIEQDSVDYKNISDKTYEIFETFQGPNIDFIRDRKSVADIRVNAQNKSPLENAFPGDDNLETRQRISQARMVQDMWHGATPEGKYQKQIGEYAALESSEAREKYLNDFISAKRPFMEKVQDVGLRLVRKVDVRLNDNSRLRNIGWVGGLLEKSRELNSERRESLRKIFDRNVENNNSQAHGFNANTPNEIDVAVEMGVLSEGSDKYKEALARYELQIAIKNLESIIFSESEGMSPDQFAGAAANAFRDFDENASQAMDANDRRELGMFYIQELERKAKELGAQIDLSQYKDGVYKSNLYPSHEEMLQELESLDGYDLPDPQDVKEYLSGKKDTIEALSQVPGAESDVAEQKAIVAARLQDIYNDLAKDHGLLAMQEEGLDFKDYTAFFGANGEFPTTDDIPAYANLEGVMSKNTNSIDTADDVDAYVAELKDGLDAIENEVDKKALLERVGDEALAPLFDRLLNEKGFNGLKQGGFHFEDNISELGFEDPKYPKYPNFDNYGGYEDVHKAIANVAGQGDLPDSYNAQQITGDLTVMVNALANKERFFGADQEEFKSRAQAALQQAHQAYAEKYGLIVLDDDPKENPFIAAGMALGLGDGAIKTADKDNNIQAAKTAIRDMSYDDLKDGDYVRAVTADDMHGMDKVLLQVGAITKLMNIYEEKLEGKVNDQGYLAVAEEVDRFNKAMLALNESEAGPLYDVPEAAKQALDHLDALKEISDKIEENKEADNVKDKLSLKFNGNVISAPFAIKRRLDRLADILNDGHSGLSDPDKDAIKKAARESVEGLRKYNTYAKKRGFNLTEYHKKFDGDGKRFGKEAVNLEEFQEEVKKAKASHSQASASCSHP